MMKHNTLIDMNRDDNGKFSARYEEIKTLRSMKLTDRAWQALKEIGDSKNISRTDVIERLARNRETKRETILRAIDTFIEDKRQAYGQNPAQKGEFKFSRSWDYFLEFRELINNAPWEVLGEED